MVAFGKRLKERQLEEWQGYRINYNLLQKQVKQFVQQIELGTLDRRHVLKDFSRMMDSQCRLRRLSFSFWNSKEFWQAG
ncbi:hypothetical protein PIB30_081960 [Stylosanthes scabra]|uniref:SPX domain-containing protein n=1 Tax=Stylosanthes scabra TaxID=79078 RepID=A0ABU6RS41_9FABA|nr:hypothetical protein [Stylosanthes scabra]